MNLKKQLFVCETIHEHSHSPDSRNESQLVNDLLHYYPYRTFAYAYYERNSVAFNGVLSTGSFYNFISLDQCLGQQFYGFSQPFQKFFANYDGKTLVTKTFDPPIVASSIAVLPTVMKGMQPCMKLSLQGCDFGEYIDFLKFRFYKETVSNFFIFSNLCKHCDIF